MTIEQYKYVAGDEVWADNGHFEIRTAVGGLPVPVGDHVIFCDGYLIVNKRTGQVDGDARSLAAAVLSAFQYQNTLREVSSAESGLVSLTGQGH